MGSRGAQFRVILKPPWATEDPDSDQPKNGEDFEPESMLKGRSNKGRVYGIAVRGRIIHVRGEKLALRCSASGMQRQVNLSDFDASLLHSKFQDN